MSVLSVASDGLARSVAVSGNGTGTLSFAVPAGVIFQLEGVYADVDATAAAGDVTATLTISEQSGVVIQKKPQASKITAGGAGSASWGLRLADDTGAGASPAALPYEAFADSVGTAVAAVGITTLPFVHAFGDVLGGFFAGRYTITAAGTYALALWVDWQVLLAAYTVKVGVRVTFGATAQAAVLTAPIPPALPLSGGGPAFAVTRPFLAGDQLDVRVAQNSGGPVNAFLYGGLCQVS